MINAVFVGERYRLVKHPGQPIGKVLDLDYVNDSVYIQWEDEGLIPPIEKYPFKYFNNGNFELVRGTYKSTCFHVWKEYKGFREDYEFCMICDEKRYK